MAKTAGIPNPAAVIAMSPVTDAIAVEEGTVLEGLDSSDQVLEVYAPGHDKADPLISPALGDLTGLPAHVSQRRRYGNPAEGFPDLRPECRKSRLPMSASMWART